MSSGKVTLQEDGDVAVLTLTDPPRNAIGPDLVADFGEALLDLRGRREFRSVVLTSSGDRFFSIGFDLPAIVDASPDDLRDFYRAFNRCCLALYTLPLPCVAALGGHATAGGCILALCCDYRLAAEGRTLLGLNEIRLGLPVPYLADRILHQLVCTRAARDILETGAFLPAAECRQIGLVDSLLPADDLLSEAMSAARSLGASPPGAYGIIKENRTGPVVRAYEALSQDREKKFLEQWFTDATQARLREALSKFSDTPPGR
jgi:enoyl-CoA hydratase/carnithine racemase